MAMSSTPCALPKVGIVDYGLGNVFSIQQAARCAGMDTFLSSDAAELTSADGVILPGVGAFGDAMDALNRARLVVPLKDIAESGKPVMGICLGMQLMMEESMEFGKHSGLGFFPGIVERLEPNAAEGRRFKVPHIGWSPVYPPEGAESDGNSWSWTGSAMEGMHGGDFVYFIHSFCVRTTDPSTILAVTAYGQDSYCAAIARGSISAFQFHPEKSGRMGLNIYRNFARQVASFAHDRMRIG